jgi:[acyl-carrier-protein] S-malonyltransferase
MQPAVPGLEQALGAAGFRDPVVPVIANATATAVVTAAEARRLLAAQLTAPVRWVGCILAAAGLVPGATYVEIGPGNVLTGLLKRIVPGAAALTLGTADEVEGFLNRA